MCPISGVVPGKKIVGSILPLDQLKLALSPLKMGTFAPMQGCTVLATLFRASRLAVSTEGMNPQGINLRDKPRRDKRSAWREVCNIPTQTLSRLFVFFVGSSTFTWLRRTDVQADEFVKEGELFIKFEFLFCSMIRIIQNRIRYGNFL